LVPRGFWRDKWNLRDYFDWIADQLGMWDIPNDWYSIKQTEILNRSGATLIWMHDNTHIVALKTAYPDYHWQDWKFPHTDNYWDDISKRIEFLDWMAEYCHIGRIESWNCLTINLLEENGAASLARAYDGSVFNILSNTYIDTEWKWWMFNVPYDTWDDMKLRLQYIHWLEEIFSIYEKDDWYGLTNEQVRTS
jgi:hypothetical protein